MSDLVEALLATVADPLWVVDGGLRIARSNGAFASLSAKGFDASTPWWVDLARRVLAGRSVSADTHAVIDGVARTFSVTGTPAGEDGAVFLARDITDLRPGVREDNLELAVTRMFEPEKPLEESLEDVLEFLCESDGWDCAVIWLIDTTTTHLEPAAVWTRRGTNAETFRSRTADLRVPRGRGVPGRAWSRDEVIWVADILDETGIVRAEAAARAGLHGAVAVPLHDADRIVGVLEVLARAVRPMSEQRRRALTRAGSSLGRLIVRRQLQQLIERKGQEWSLTFDAIELPVFITRLDGAIARVNRAARDLIGSGGFRDILGLPIRIQDAEPWITLADIVAAVRDSGTPCTAQVQVGERHWDINASWYRSAADEEERVIVVMRDTTDLIRLQESVRRGEQLAALGELVAGVAHEVRNPIFGMGLTVDALEELLPKSPDTAELYGILRAWLDRLNRLMENLLQYGKTWSLDLREGTVDSVLAPVVDGCRQIAAQSSVRVEADVEPQLTMLMDATRLSHAFENLLMNAIQHSKPEQCVTMTAHDVDGTIECVVRDQGPGFNPFDLPRVFQPFFTKRRGGTGLGLSIVQRIVDEHGGTITATNAADGGAVLTMKFPRYKV